MRAFIAAIAVIAALIAGCTSETEEFCTLNEQLDRKASEENIEPGTPEFVALVDELAAVAPDEVRDDIRLVGEANRDPRSADIEAVREADANLEAFMDEHC